MELLQIKDLNFKYASADLSALKDVSLSVSRGSFTLLCGKSGCGKTTLLRLLKREISPHGEKSGEVLYDGVEIGDLDARVSAADIGFVGQNPDEQIVTDKVWHELAFGLENLGLDRAAIRRRVGEMASYFGIQNWYHKNTDELSGGQKQLLNLAAVMVMQPKILLLDEPTAQLDPIAASDFIATLKKLNTELGLTIILAEHRLEDVFAVSDAVAVMENGRISVSGNPVEVCAEMKESSLFGGFPAAARIWSELDVDCKCPLTVREGRDFLAEHFSERKGSSVVEKERTDSESVFQAREIWFRYEKKLPDVLRGFSIGLRKGEIYSIMGGNGSGKSTALNVLAGIERPYKGKSKLFGKKMSDYKRGSLYRNTLALLPQNPKTVFLKNTVREDLYEMLKAMDIPKGEYDNIINLHAQSFEISGLLEKHPYDLSGGEQQKCAIVKLLLGDPRILLLDEPTKGMDTYSKKQLSALLFKLKEQGRTVLIVTHDIEFAAYISDRCGLLFDGKIISEGTPNEFFSGNNFYTTAASRISRGIFNNAVLCEEVSSLCKGRVL